MKFKSINDKKVSYEKLRMTEPTILFGAGVSSIAEYTVGDGEVCRIDLVSQRFFGTADYSDFILKYNNISNPFSLTTGDVLLIPDVLAALKNWKSIKPVGVDSDQVETIKDQFISSKRLTIKDQKRIDYLKKKAAQRENGSSQILPPNFLKEGDKNLRIERGNNGNSNSNSNSGIGNGNNDLDGGTIII